MIEDKFVAPLAPHVKYLEVCPELEIGMGTPREPVRIVLEGQRVPMIQTDTDHDFTEKIERFGQEYVGNLSESDGFDVFYTECLAGTTRRRRTEPGMGLKSSG